MSIWGKLLPLGLAVQPQPSVQYLQYIRTNYSDFSLTLSNWIYDLGDTWELVYKQDRSPNQTGNWPAVIGTSIANNANLYLQYNLWNNRRVMNISYNRQYTGDGSITFDGPYDYTNYYKIRCAAGAFSILKGASLDDITTMTASKTFTAATGSTSEAIILFPLSGNYRLDNSFYSLTVWRSGEKIHEYLPIADGLHDAVTGNEYIVTSTGHINGPEA